MTKMWCIHLKKIKFLLVVKIYLNCLFKLIFIFSSKHKQVIYRYYKARKAVHINCKLLIC